MIGLTEEEIFSILDETKLSEEDKYIIAGLISKNNRAIENQFDSKVVEAMNKKTRDYMRTKF
ncbi:hypothetical protein [Sporosarcina obsidiansis]|uniref:hypothetical protein n=1 Tax=Sporosarcina obsidiansis TaxID=2660748 RepID=UPI00129BD5FA|nr:hypothetical protein [Sporosarcina obsidiansis]